MITRLKLHQIGSAPDLEADFGERLNLVTGDNGLGKTFLLDACWYALTQTWADDRVTRQLPSNLVTKAEFTLKQLRLHNGKKVVRNRKRWYQQFKVGMLTLDGLKSNAPLVAEAVNPTPRPQNPANHRQDPVRGLG